MTTLLALLVLLLLYTSTVLFSYYCVRKELILKKSDPDGMDFIMIFIPMGNIIWGLLSWWECNTKEKKKTFFNLD